MASHQSSRPVGFFLHNRLTIFRSQASRSRSGSHVGMPAQKNRAAAQDGNLQP
jgi:hypothetical protein